jgi:hypothetical protein
MKSITKVQDINYMRWQVYLTPSIPSKGPFSLVLTFKRRI